MSTNKTPNYNLHSWLPQDEFHLTEINENFAKLDVALKIEATAATQKSNALESALGQRVRMVTGSYTGKTGANNDQTTATHVNLGFKPKAVVIINAYRGVSGPDMSFLAHEGIQGDTAVTLNDTGFTAINLKGDVSMNYNRTVYHYAAFY